MPFYLATQEFFRLVRERLAPGGIVALNVATVPGDHRLARDVAGTLAWEFPQVVSWQALRFSRLVLGLSRPLAPAELRRRLAAPGPAPLAPLRALLARQLRPAGRIAAALDGRPRPGRVGDRPDDPRVRAPRPRRAAEAAPDRTLSGFSRLHSAS